MTLGALTVLVSAAIVVGVPWWQARRELAHGVELVAAGRYRSAVRTLVHAVAASPDSARAHYYLGFAYARMGMRAGAARQLAAAARLGGDGPIGAMARRELAAAGDADVDTDADAGHQDNPDTEGSMR